VFGEILDIGIITEKATGFFMDTGYAVLDIYQSPDTSMAQKLPELSHQISWRESTTEVFHATWNNMPTWCRYCHKDGHTKFECPLSKARILCYSCHQQGHRSYEYPRRNASSSPNKKPDRKSYQTRDSTSSSADDDNEKGVLPDSQNVDNKNNDDLSTIEENNSIVDEEEQMSRDNIEIIKQELDQYSPEQIQNAIKLVYEAQENAPINKPNDSQGVIGWTIVQRTEHAEALVTWMKMNKYSHLAQSTSIINRRPSQILLGESNSQKDLPQLQ
jgi:hypothetical protein